MALNALQSPMRGTNKSVVFYLFCFIEWIHMDSFIHLFSNQMCTCISSVEICYMNACAHLNAWIKEPQNHLCIPLVLRPPKKSSRCQRACSGAPGSRFPASWCTSGGSCPTPADSAPPPIDPSDTRRRWRSTSSRLHAPRQRGMTCKRHLSISFNERWI